MDKQREVDFAYLEKTQVQFYSTWPPLCTLQKMGEAKRIYWQHHGWEALNQALIEITATVHAEQERLMAERRGHAHDVLPAKASYLRSRKRGRRSPRKEARPNRFMRVQVRG